MERSFPLDYEQLFFNDIDGRWTGFLAPVHNNRHDLLEMGDEGEACRHGQVAPL